jgi:hypothetical protein
VSVTRDESGTLLAASFPKGEVAGSGVHALQRYPAGKELAATPMKGAVMMVDGPCPVAQPPDGQVQRVANLVDRLLANDWTPCLIEKFYDPSGRFAGDTFLALSPNEPFSIGVSDLLAVSLLDEPVGAVGVRQLLPNGRLSQTASMFLARIPLGVPLWESSDDTLGWANCLWKLLVDEATTVGHTKAGKLLARKRPELVPIVDSTVAENLDCAPGTYWTTFRAILRDRQRRDRLRALRPGYPLLRVLDTMLWMHYSQSQNARQARAECDPIGQPERIVYIPLPS